MFIMIVESADSERVQYTVHTQITCLESRGTATSERRQDDEHDKCICNSRRLPCSILQSRL